MIKSFFPNLNSNKNLNLNKNSFTINQENNKETNLKNQTFMIEEISSDNSNINEENTKRTNYEPIIQEPNDLGFEEKGKQNINNRIFYKYEPKIRRNSNLFRNLSLNSNQNQKQNLSLNSNQNQNQNLFRNQNQNQNQNQNSFRNQNQNSFRNQNLFRNQNSFGNQNIFGNQNSFGNQNIFRTYNFPRNNKERRLTRKKRKITDSEIEQNPPEKRLVIKTTRKRFLKLIPNISQEELSVIPFFFKQPQVLDPSQAQIIPYVSPQKILLEIFKKYSTFLDKDISQISIEFEEDDLNSDSNNDMIFIEETNPQNSPNFSENEYENEYENELEIENDLEIENENEYNFSSFPLIEEIENHENSN